MPQALLPLIPDGATRVSGKVSVIQENGEWIYLLGVDPIFRHPENNRRLFRMITSQLVYQGLCRPCEIVSAFGVSANSVKRGLKKFREEGLEGFVRPPGRRGATVMTDEVIARAQELFRHGSSRREVANELEIRYDTLRKAINQGRLNELPTSEKTSEPTSEPQPHAIDKSKRSEDDISATMGVACTRPEERVLAAIGALDGAPTRFEPSRDVSFGGVLCALPALAANGLFDHLAKVFPSLTGYYTTLQVVVLLANMALCRIKTVEQLQYESPGELGKLMGLDRVPEVRCLRNKLAQLSLDSAPEKWAGHLSKQWLEAAPERAGTLYVDGHVRLYHGKQTKLPKRYVSRQRLCHRGTTDYWVNDALGLPFFSVERSIDHGLLEALRNDIVPRLLNEVPDQPDEEQLKKDPCRARFVIVFDREGYSPAFFKEMWQTHRIACITYHKFPKTVWPEAEFSERQVSLPRGETLSLKVAERGSWIGNKQDGLWVREVRKLTNSGHQVSLISSAFGQLALDDAAGLLSRWSQENFFRYMMEHYAIDLLSEYRTEEIPGTIQPVVNPRWRDLDRRFRSLKGTLQRRRAEFAAHTLHPETDSKAIPRWERRKSEMLEVIDQLEHELGAVKQQRKETPHHLKWDDLAVEDQFERLAPSRKCLLDTVKLIAYRAETAMTDIVREELSRDDDARSLVRDLFRMEVDLSPDPEAGVLRIEVHSMSNPRFNRAIAHLLHALNSTETCYPGTNLKLVFRPPDPKKRAT